MLFCVDQKHGDVAADKATCTVLDCKVWIILKMVLTWVDLLAVLQNVDGQKEREHELVGLKQAAADIDEQGVGEGLVQGSAALCYSLCLQ